MALIDDVRQSLRITTTAFDNEITRLINAGKKDLQIAGVLLPDPLDDECSSAIVLYCKCNFGQPDNYDHLKKCYDEQKAQLSMATGYTTWTGQTS